MKHIVYKTTNKINNKIYIGVHSQVEDDSYLGSGKNILSAIRKYGRENFTRETIEVFETPIEAYRLESQLVNEEFLKRPDVYNLVLGGMGGVLKTNRTPLSEEMKSKISKGVRARLEKHGTNRVYGEACQGSKDALIRSNKARTLKMMTTNIEIDGVIYGNKILAAESLGVSTKTIGNWLKTGKAKV